MNVTITVEEVPSGEGTAYQRALIAAVRKSEQELNQLREVGHKFTRLVFVKCSNPKNLKFLFKAS